MRRLTQPTDEHDVDSTHSKERLYWLAVLGGAAYFAIGVLYWRSHDAAAVGSNDTYMYAYPNLVHALRSLREGAGWFWNPYQDCGQPFFAISQTGLLYPLNWLVALLPREAGLITNIMVHLCIGGAATYRLARVIDLTPAAALCAALAFELGGSTLDLAAWSPIHIGAYAWVPVALWRTECLIRRPGWHAGCVLGLVLTLQLLPGFPQILFFTYQLVALRVGWALATRQTAQPTPLIGSAVAALALPLGLGAVQLLPSLEVARESLRTLPLNSSEVGGFKWTWSAVRVLGSIDLFGLMLAVVGLVSCRRVARSTTYFYALVALLYGALSFGPGTFLFDLYARLPMGTAFRGSARLLWVVGFAIAILVGIGAQAILELRARGPYQAWIAMIPVVLGTVLLHGLTAEGARFAEWTLAAAVIATAVAGATWVATPMHALLPLLVALHAVAVVPKPFAGLRAGDVYGAHRDAFQWLRERLTPQQRVLIFGQPGDYALMPKSATLFAVPDIFDYEPQVSRTYAELFTYMRTGRGVQVLDDWYWIFKRLLPTTVQPRLLDLMAPRYFLIDRKKPMLPPALSERLHLVAQRGDVQIYENPNALPRAFYVPRIVVMPAEKILPSLMDGTVDPLRVAAVSEAPRSGFLGSDGDASGTTDITENGAETVRLHVRATAPGFVFLADQFFPGWAARVNGADREILRGNYTFRLVEVPAGDSEVVFTYRPRAVWIGATISLVTGLVAAALWISRRQQARIPAPACS